MNVFEDLIEALKEDSLLESTVIDGAAKDQNAVESAPGNNALRTSSAAKLDETLTAELDFEVIDADDVPAAEAKPSSREFFKQRAMEEVSSLQMVEHIFSGVEREHMKIVPAPFNDIRIKQALHRYSQVTDDSSAEESSAAEFELIQQTQQWFSVLADRDRNRFTRIPSLARPFQLPLCRRHDAFDFVGQIDAALERQTKPFGPLVHLVDAEHVADRVEIGVARLLDRVA